MTPDAQNGVVPATHDEILRLCGDIVDWKISAIMATSATPEELEECIAWLSGGDDVMGEERKPLSGRVAELYDILTADDEWQEPDRT